MAKTIVGLYDSMDHAQAAVRDLVDLGIERNDISLMARDTSAEAGATREVGGREETKAAEGAAAGAGIGAAVGGIGGLLVGLGALTIPGIGPIIAAGPLVAALAGAGIGAGAGAVVGALVGMGIPEEEAQYYAEGVRRGGTLVAVRTADEMTDRVVDVMERHNPVDIERRTADWRSSGWKGFDASARPITHEEIESSRSRWSTTDRPMTSDRDLPRDREGTIKEVREDIDIGKREIEKGGVRVRSHVISEPVEKDVTLREENVNVEKRPVDRPASEHELHEAFQEKTIEMRETSEEPVVRKQARVVQEIDLSKDVSQRTETVRDTVRRTEAEVEDLSGREMRGFDTYENDFRTDFNTRYANRGYTYDQYRPAYRYGFDLANSPAYRDRDWPQIEMEARRRWEERNQGTWEDFKDAIHDAWMRARGKGTRSVNR